MQHMSVMYAMKVLSRDYNTYIIHDIRDHVLKSPGMMFEHLIGFIHAWTLKIWRCLAASPIFGLDVSLQPAIF